MKWFLCLFCLGAGLLGGVLVNRCLRPGPALSGTGPSPGPITPAAAAVTDPADAASFAETDWKNLMRRARAEFLPDLDTIIRRGGAVPLDYLGALEQSLAVCREISQGTDLRRISSVLVPAPGQGKVLTGSVSPVGNVSGFLLWQLGSRDPEGALAAQERGMMETRSPIFAAWAEKDFPAALKTAAENYQELDHAYNIVTVLSVMARSDPAEAIRLATGLQREGEDLVAGILMELASNSPHRAFSFLLEPGNGLELEQASILLRDTVSSLAGESGGSPWEPLSELADRPGLATAVGESLGVWAAMGVRLQPEALPILEKLPLDAQEKAMISGMAIALYRSDPVLADQVLAKLPEGAAQRAVEAAMSGAIMGGSIGNMPNTTLGQRLASLLPYERQFELMDSQNLYAAFTVSKGEAWISNVDDPYWHDQFAAKFAAEFEGWDPAGAARVAASISDPTQRETALSAALTAWRAKEPGAAAAWEAGMISHPSE